MSKEATGTTGLAPTNVSVAAPSPTSEKRRGERMRILALLPDSQPRLAASVSQSCRLPLRPLLRIVCFFGLLGLAAIGLDRTFTFGLRHIQTSEFGASNAIMSGRVNAQVVISGSSRALVHYDPRIIQSITGLSAFNLGRNAAQTDMQWAFLKAYLKHNAKPRVVIHNLDPYSFVLTREVFDPGQYLPYLNEEEIYKPLRQIDPSVWKWKYIPLYGYAVEDMRFTWITAVKRLVGINPREDYFLGYNPRHLHWTGDFERYKSSISAGVKIEIQPQAVKLLEDLAQTCQSQGIQVVFVFAPEYFEMQSLTLNRAEMFSRFQEIADRFKVPFWDYSQSGLCRDRDLFYNSQHMNQEGASLFSSDIARRLSLFNLDQLPNHRRAARNLNAVSPAPSVLER